MKTKLVLLFCFLIGIVSCKRDLAITPIEINGKFIGTFERKKIKAPVVLTFSNGSFDGSSEKTNFPAICKGTYTITNNRIRFENQCFWTADFDWTLILNDEWQFGLTTTTLTMKHKNGDTYQLIKQ